MLNCLGLSDIILQCDQEPSLKRQEQAILSQEAYGILLLPLHSNRIDCCCSSMSCV